MDEEKNDKVDVESIELDDPYQNVWIKNFNFQISKKGNTDMIEKIIKNLKLNKL